MDGSIDWIRSLDDLQNIKYEAGELNTQFGRDDDKKQ